MSDEFTGDSGLKDDYDGTIVKSEFEQSERGNWQLHLVVAADDGDEVDYFYSVGAKDKGWTSYDGGETIQGATAKSKFHDQTAMQKFIYKTMDTEAANVLRERSAGLYNRRGPFHAALWLGLRFHWDVVTEKQNRPQKKIVDGIETNEEEWVETDVQVSRPTRFLGVADGTTPAAAPAAAPVAAGSSGPQPMAANEGGPATNGASTSSGYEGVSDEEVASLTKLALMSDSHGDFVDAAMEADGPGGEKLIKNRAVVKLIGKKDFYESVKG